MEQQVYIRMAASEDTHWWFVARRSILHKFLSTYLKLPEHAWVLEAGCGTGGNLNMLGKFGKVFAFEPNEEARKLALQRGHYDIRIGQLPHDIPFDENTFDLVTALDVVEHVEDDRSCLQALWNQLRPGGWLLLTVPAFQFLWSDHDKIHHHRHRYNKHQLEQVVTEAGFTPKHICYFNTFLFPLITIVRLTKTTLNIRNTPEDLLPSPFLNKILETVFKGERSLVGHIPFPFGLSLLMLAQKSRSL